MNKLSLRTRKLILKVIIVSLGLLVVFAITFVEYIICKFITNKDSICFLGWLLITSPIIAFIFYSIIEKPLNRISNAKDK